MPESKVANENEKPPPKTKSYANEWMIRPCEIYKEEYLDCKSIKARFHQYFIFGKYTDCTQWKTDYDNCYTWKKYNSKEAYDKLINSEIQRRRNRLQGHYKNDVWQKRDKPPENWNAPLPEWLEQKSKNSYLRIANAKLQEDKKIKPQPSSCTIM